MKMGRSIVLGIAALASIGSSASAQLDLIDTQIVASGLTSPLYVAFPPGDDSRMFVVERGGRIRLYVNGVLQGTDFLNLTGVLTPTGGTITFGGNTYTIGRGNEQGVLGLAFAPDYATSGTFYVNFVAERFATIPNPPSSTDYSFGCAPGCSISDRGRTVIAKFQRDPNNPNICATPVITDLSQFDAILQVDQPFTNHNGGNIQFGPDGFLYVGMGDGGSGNDPGNRALNPNELLGKMLRIDVSGDDFPADPLRDYRIPAGNPFAAGGGRAEIWAVGKRNPWRWSFDNATGDLWIADVGQDAWEEVNFVPGNGGPGRNYGWRVREGNATTGLSSGGFSTANLTFPVYVYSHGGATGQGFSITGGYVYRGRAIRGIRGRYFFADYVVSSLRSGRMINNQFVDYQENYTQANNVATDTLRQISSFGQDNAGELYIVQLSGVVRKIIPSATAYCPADLDNGGGNGRPDGGVDINDLLFYLQLFATGDIGADQDDGSGTGTFDNGVAIEDLLYYLERFAIGC